MNKSCRAVFLFMMIDVQDRATECVIGMCHWNVSQNVSLGLARFTPGVRGSRGYWDSWGPIQESGALSNPIYASP